MSKKYSDVNDYELAYLVSENNEDASDIFFDKYDNIIRIKATKYKDFTEENGYDFNDLVQEGRLGLVKAIDNFKDQKNTTFYTFANICIDRQLASFVRNISREKHKILNNSISLETPIDGIGKPLTDLIKDDKNVNPEVFAISNQLAKDLYNKIIKKLTKNEKVVLDLKLKGFTNTEISKQLNNTPKAVTSTLRRIRNKINVILND
jgi:RNA polymerase sporulation-specific sigma factor